MTLKKSRIISIIGIILLAFIFHFGYQILPNFVTAIFFPVNESIWEHMKLLFTSVLFYSIIDYIILNKFNIKYNNFFINSFITASFVIPIYLIIYLPLFYKIGPSMTLNITIMVISIILVEILSYFILNEKNYELLNKISIVLIILTYIAFSILTYYPIKCELFFDTEKEKYGLNNYNV